jgi:hypothetical protein
VTSRGGHGPPHKSEQTPPARRSGAGWSAVVGNERLTALVSAVLLVLFLGVLVTLLSVHALLPLHVFVGVLLAGPLAVKVGSTGYRSFRYYTGSPAFVRRGPPRPVPRILGPLLLATTLVVTGSGLGLLLTGPDHLLALPWLAP